MARHAWGEGMISKYERRRPTSKGERQDSIWTKGLKRTGGVLPGQPTRSDDEIAQTFLRKRVPERERRGGRDTS